MSGYHLHFCQLCTFIDLPMADVLILCWENLIVPIKIEMSQGIMQIAWKGDSGKRNIQSDFFWTVGGNDSSLWLSAKNNWHMLQ